MRKTSTSLHQGKFRWGVSIKLTVINVLAAAILRTICDEIIPRECQNIEIPYSKKLVRGNLHCGSITVYVENDKF